MYENNLKKADIDFATSGDHTVIEAPDNGYIAIDHINFLPNSAVTIQLKDGSTAYGGAYYLNNQAYTIENAMLNPKGVITLSAGSAFVINTNAAVQVSGFCRYRIVV
jgi:uncharacterized protein YlzI (FlbEa/FlbD family)